MNTLSPLTFELGFFSQIETHSFSCSLPRQAQIKLGTRCTPQVDIFRADSGVANHEVGFGALKEEFQRVLRKSDIDQSGQYL